MGSRASKMNVNFCAWDAEMCLRARRTRSKDSSHQIQLGPKPLEAELEEAISSQNTPEESGFFFFFFFRSEVMGKKTVQSQVSRTLLQLALKM